MAIVKRTNANLVIQTPRDVSSNITLDSDNIVVRGNLNVLGNTTQITTVNTNIKDNIIVLNDGETGAGVTAGTAGIQINRGSSANVALLWNENLDQWQLTTDGSTYSNIASTSGGGGVAITAVVQDPAPVLGGNLNTDGYTIRANTNVKFSGNLQVSNTLVAPGAVTGATVLYAQAPNSGQAGLYVVNSDSTNEELITKRRAFGFSLIL